MDQKLPSDDDDHDDKMKWIQEQQQQQQQLQQQQQQQQMADDIKLRWSSDDFYPSDEEISTAVFLGMISLK